MKLISEYQDKQGRRATVRKSLREKCFVVEYYDADNRKLQTAIYPHLEQAEASAEDFCLTKPITADDSTVIECGPVTLTPVEQPK